MRWKSGGGALAAGAAFVFGVGALCGVGWAQVQRVDVSTLPFSPARQADGTLYVSGQIPTNPDGTIVTGSIGDQTRRTMDNIGAILKNNGYSFANVVNVTVYLSDMKHYQDMNAAYREYFPDGKFPARACVGGMQLALDAEMEISAIARR